MTVAELLRDLRGEMTQDEFANTLGISQAQISRLLAGTREIGETTLAALLKSYPTKRDTIMDVFLSQNKTNRNDSIPIMEAAHATPEQ